MNKEELKNKVNCLFNIFFITIGSYIIYSLTIHKFENAIKTLVIIATGIPIYFIWKKIKCKKLVQN